MNGGRTRRRHYLRKLVDNKINRWVDVASLRDITATLTDADPTDKAVV